ncbi:TonB-dependent receptor [Fulvivirgaceae bacterium PWU37]|uniref:TonB-dependent receptor n=2 Tax=Dawidia soli TaxID=2782352 RepID=A0AAP2GJK9_9BACT|nr:TonB-dependent receptor [Dawidia soli]
MNVRTLLAMLLTFAIPRLALSQAMVTGRVTEAGSGQALPGVNVSIQGTTSGTVTDADGTFAIAAAADNVLLFSFIGYKTITEKVGDRSTIDIELPADVSQLDEIVVTGYSTQEKKDLTGAVSVVKMTEIKDMPTANPMRALQGRVPGVTVTADGSPGGGATVRIRGIGTLGNNDPLYIIDGMPTKNGLEQINPADIESMQVLKDASAATIYGSRAANGVIIITTKKAKAGFSKVTFNSSLSTQRYTTQLDMLNTQERARVYWQSAVNDGVDPSNHQIYDFDWEMVDGVPVLNQVILPEFIDAQQTMRPADTDWYKEIARTSLIQSYDISIANGGDKSSTFFSLSYFDNKGIIKESQSKRYTARLNSEYNFFNKKLKVGENLMATHFVNTLIPINDVMYTALVQQTLVPVHTVTGGWGGPAPGMNDRHNPVRLIDDNKQNKGYFVRLMGNAYADLEVIRNLHLRTSFGIDYQTNYERTLRKSYVSGFLSDPSNQVNTKQDVGGNWVWQNSLTYDLDLSRNTFNFLLGSEMIRYVGQDFWASRRGYALEEIDYAYLNPGSSNKDNGGGGSSNALLSQFAKVNYSYDDRYLASVTVRRDGSSRFGSDNQYGIFPAFSLGWRLSEEQFIKESIPVVSNLKLRYGWGKTGNQEIANNATNTLYESVYATDGVWNFDRGTAYDIGGAGTGQLPAGFALIQQGNSGLKWETSIQSNYGVDFGFLDEKIAGSVDYFVKKTSDILIEPAYLAVIGEGGKRWANGASMENKGIEVLLSYSETINDLSFTITGNISTYRNKITKLPDEILGSYPGNGTDKTILGRSVNSIFGYVADGIFQSQAEVEAHAAQVGKGIGRIRYKDLDDNDEINDRDRDYIGVKDPKFSYGLNASVTYKNFDLNFFWQGVKGNDVENSYKTLTDFPTLWAGSNWGRRSLDAWTPQNPNSTIPAVTLVDSNNEGRASTYFVEKGSYLKLRNVQLGYTVKGLAGSGVQNLRFYVQANNLVTIKSRSYTAPDPENPGNAYPIPVIYTGGLNLSF